MTLEENGFNSNQLPWEPIVQTGRWDAFEPTWHDCAQPQPLTEHVRWKCESQGHWVPTSVWTGEMLNLPSRDQLMFVSAVFYCVHWSFNALARKTRTYSGLLDEPSDTTTHLLLFLFVLYREEPKRLHFEKLFSRTKYSRDVFVRVRNDFRASEARLILTYAGTRLDTPQSFRARPCVEVRSESRLTALVLKLWEKEILLKSHVTCWITNHCFAAGELLPQTYHYQPALPDLSDQTHPHCHPEETRFLFCSFTNNLTYFVLAICAVWQPASRFNCVHSATHE